MALKAGYHGIKKSLLDKLLQMSGALVIKSLGTALSLSDAGELRVRNASDSHSGVIQPDGETTSIVDGKLVSKGGVSFTALEQDTGLKWVNGKKIYQKTYYFNKTDLDTCTTNESIGRFVTGISKGDVDLIWIDESASFVKTYAQSNETVMSTPVNYASENGKIIRTNIQTESNPTSDSPLNIYYKATYNTVSVYNYGVDVYITLLYTKASENVLVN